jgi:hypothetical protein
MDLTEIRRNNLERALVGLKRYQADGGISLALCDILDIHGSAYMYATRTMQLAEITLRDAAAVMLSDTEPTLDEILNLAIQYLEGDLRGLPRD